MYMLALPKIDILGYMSNEKYGFRKARREGEPAVQFQSRTAARTFEG